MNPSTQDPTQDQIPAPEGTPPTPPDAPTPVPEVPTPTPEVPTPTPEAPAVDTPTPESMPTPTPAPVDAPLSEADLPGVEPTPDPSSPTVDPATLTGGAEAKPTEMMTAAAVTAPPAKHEKRLIYIGLILAIVSIVLSFIWALATPLAFAGLILAIIALVQKKPGKKLAITTIVLSAVSLFIVIPFWTIASIVLDFS